VTDEPIILLAEDRPEDIILIRRAFAQGGIDNPLYIVRDGEEAIAYLSGFGRYSNREEFPLPHLLLLDIKMPKVDGFEVLKWVRQQPGFGTLVVIVLTSSQDIFDVNKAYGLGANSFLVKPMDFDNFRVTCKTIKDYWLHMNKLPETQRPPKKGKNGATNGTAPNL